jgi:hypothetical protein
VTRHHDRKAGRKTEGEVKRKPMTTTKENPMKSTKNLLIAAAVTGALTGLPLVSFAGTLSPMPGPGADKLGCQGMAGQKGEKDKQSCHAKDKQGKKQDKAACSGKNGCGGKDMHK